MSVVAGDLKIYFSGGSGNTSGDASLGGAISTTEAAQTLNGLFDEVTGDEHTAGETNYRAIFFKNTAAETAYNVKFWIETQSTGADSSVEIAKETAGGSPIQTVADEDTAPTGLSFVTADGQANALQLGDMAAGDVYGIWIKRIISAGSTPQANDTVTFKCYIDTL